MILVLWPPVCVVAVQHRDDRRRVVSEIGSAELGRASYPQNVGYAKAAMFDAEYLLNFALASMMLVFFAPLMVVVALAVFVQDGGPVLFAHQRVGRGGRMFACLKFRSMAVDAQERLQQVLASDPAAREEWERDHKLRNDPRITRLGDV
jgi:exopolysaccharide production protein ExoY